MKKHYCYFDDEGNEAKCAGGISCDLCSKDCTAESFLMDDQVCVCLRVVVCVSVRRSRVRAGERVINIMCVHVCVHVCVNVWVVCVSVCLCVCMCVCVCMYVCMYAERVIDTMYVCVCVCLCVCVCVCMQSV